MQIGVDLGGSHISVGIISDNGKIISKKEKNMSLVDTKNQDKRLLIIDNIISMINSLLKEIQIPSYVINKIGIGIPGIVSNNIIEKCDKFGLFKFDLANELEKYYAVPIILKNDALCAALAEKIYGNLKDVQDGVFLCLGTGIGGATIIDGKIMSSEYGHMCIEKDGIKCNCGNNGCFQNYCSMREFKKNTINILNLDESIDSKKIVEILKNRRENIKLEEYIDKYINYLALGICNISNIVNPEIICIGGSFVYYQEILLYKLKEQLKKYNFRFNIPQITVGKLENDAGIIGAIIG